MGKPWRQPWEKPWGKPLSQPRGQPWGKLWGQPWMQTLDRKKYYLKKWDSKPGKIDDFHEMKLFSLSIYIRKISNLTTEIQRLNKNLRRPRLEYQDR